MVALLVLPDPFLVCRLSVLAEGLRWSSTDLIQDPKLGCAPVVRRCGYGYCAEGVLGCCHAIRFSSRRIGKNQS